MATLLVIPGYVELIELLLACSNTDAAGDFDSFSSDLDIGIDQADSLLFLFKRIRDDANWSIKVTTDFFSEIGESALFFSDLPERPGQIIRLEETMQKLKEDFARRADCVVRSFLLNRLGFSEDEVSRTLGGDLSVAAEAIEKANDLSQNTLWFITQLIKFPQQSLELLLFALGQLKTYYEESGLRDRNLESVGSTMVSIVPEKLRELPVEALEFHGIAPRNEFPLCLLLQNTLRYSTLSYTYACNTQFIVLSSEMNQFEEILKPEITDNSLRLFLKNFSDPTKMQLMKEIASEPKFVDELAKLLCLSKATISHHLSSLSQMALVSAKKDRRRLYFSLNKKRIENLLKKLEDFYEEGDASWR